MKQSFIKRDEDFKSVIRSGKSANSNALRAKYTDGKTADIRLGVVISKGNINSAVKRNRAKRLVKEAFRALKGVAKRPLDIVVFAKGPAIGLKIDEAAVFLRGIIERS